MGGLGEAVRVAHVTAARHHGRLVAAIVDLCAVEEAWARMCVEIGSVYVNKKRVLGDGPVAEGDYLRVYLNPLRFNLGSVATWRRERIRYVGPHYAVLDKPSYVPSQPTVDNAVENVLVQMRTVLGGDALPTTRLDQPTSGLLVIARTRAFQREFNANVQAGRVRKLYHAYVPDTPAAQALPLGMMTHWMKPSRRAPREVSAEAHEGWKECRLELLGKAPCVLRDTGERMVQLRIRLHTGRTHQVRVQLAASGTPVMGEEIYSVDPAETAKAHFHAHGDSGFFGLHCFSLDFRSGLLGGHVTHTAVHPDVKLL